jgi:hypothetical protein
MEAPVGAPAFGAIGRTSHRGQETAPTWKCPPAARWFGEGVTVRDNYQGRHSIRINEQWRIVFRWQGGNALDVEVTDYH